MIGFKLIQIIIQNYLILGDHQMFEVIILMYLAAAIGLSIYWKTKKII